MNSRSEITEQKKQAAKILYLEGFEQQVIAKITGRSEATITGWKKDGNWQDERIKIKLREDNIAERVNKLIEYQLNAIDYNIELTNKLREEQMDESGEIVHRPLISKGEIDALSKLNAMVKHKNINWLHVVNIMKDYMEHLQISNLELAQKSIIAIEEFLQLKQELLK